MSASEMFMQSVRFIGGLCVVAAIIALIVLLFQVPRALHNYSSFDAPTQRNGLTTVPVRVQYRMRRMQLGNSDKWPSQAVVVDRIKAILNVSSNADSWSEVAEEITKDIRVHENVAGVSVQLLPASGETVTSTRGSVASLDSA